MSDSIRLPDEPPVGTVIRPEPDTGKRYKRIKTSGWRRDPRGGSIEILMTWGSVLHALGGTVVVINPDDPSQDPIGTVRVHPDDDPEDPNARRRIATEDGDYDRDHQGCRWARLTSTHKPTDEANSEWVRGWPRQALADVARVLGHLNAGDPS